MRCNCPQLPGCSVPVMVALRMLALLLALACSCAAASQAKLSGWGVNTHKTSWTTTELDALGSAFTVARTDFRWSDVLGSRFCTKSMISEGTSRASLPYLVAIHHNPSPVCLYVAHILQLCGLLARVVPSEIPLRAKTPSPGDVEKAAGAYDFTMYDSLMSQFRGHGITPYMILDYGNPLYDKGTAPVSPAAVVALARWATASIGRYKGQGVIWEFWTRWYSSTSTLHIM